MSLKPSQEPGVFTSLVGTGGLFVGLLALGQYAQSGEPVVLDTQSRAAVTEATDALRTIFTSIEDAQKGHSGLGIISSANERSTALHAIASATASQQLQQPLQCVGTECRETALVSPVFTDAQPWHFSVKSPLRTDLNNYCGVLGDEVGTLVDVTHSDVAVTHLQEGVRLTVEACLEMVSTGLFDCTLLPPHKTEPVVVDCQSTYPVYGEIIQTHFVPEVSPLMVTVETN